jgi:hypothetical protein
VINAMEEDGFHIMKLSMMDIINLINNAVNVILQEEIQINIIQGD